LHFEGYIMQAMKDKNEEQEGILSTTENAF
jgi:hypothetical protein